MNGLVPALVAVLLAELGQRGGFSGKAWRGVIVWVGITAIVVVASLAGQLLAPRMTDWAVALMIGVALALAAVGQLFKAKARVSRAGLLWGFWSGGAPLIAFALAIRFGAWSSAVGTLIGTVIAGVATAAATRNAVPLRAARAVAAVVLFAIAAVVAVGALRLV